MNKEHRTKNAKSSESPQGAECRTTSAESRVTSAGFSLIEVLLAVGTLAIGMLFIAGVFPVSIHLVTVASERTIAATVADEAFAKIKLYGIYDPNVTDITQTNYENAAPVLISDAEFAYPSTPTDDIRTKRYWWSAICRRIDSNDVQVTVFISRKAGNTKFYAMNPTLPPTYNSAKDYPVAVPVEVAGVFGSDTLTITGNLGGKNWINDGYTIVDDATGQIYRVLERYKSNDNVIRLDRNLQGPVPQRVWTVPSSAANPYPDTIGRYPCIAVYQKVMRF